MAAEILTHDGLFRFLAWLDGGAAAVARMAAPPLPPGFAEADFDPEVDQFIDERLRKELADPVFGVVFREGRFGNCLMVLEHKAYPVYFVAVQILRYLAAVLAIAVAWKRPLRATVPIVVYNGAEPWTPPQMADLFPGPEELRDGWPDFRFRVVDLGRMSDHEIVGPPGVRAALLALKHGQRDDLGPAYVQIFRELIAAMPDEEQRRPISRALLQYLAGGVRRLTQGDLDAILHAMHSPEKQLMETLHQHWIEVGEQRGIEIGEQRGIEIGNLIGMRAGVEGLLAVRFPAEAAELQAPLAACQDVNAMSALLAALRNGEALDAVKQRIAAESTRTQ